MKNPNGSLAKHQMKLMKKSNTLAITAAIQQSEKKVLKNTKSQCMRESSTLAKIATMRQLQKEILKNSKSQHIKESSTLAKISDMMNQLQMGNHKKKLTKSWCMDVSNSIANIVAINQLQTDHLQNTIRTFKLK